MDSVTGLARDLDFRNRSNAAIAGLTVLAAIAALILYLNGSPAEVFFAPAHVFVMWALVREIDPDHGWTALIAAVIAGGWVLQAESAMSLLALGGLLVAGRLVSGTTGMRPTNIDLAVLTVGGSAIGFSLEGWMAGFGLAIAIYLDDRMAVVHRPAQTLVAGATALGTTLVAAFSGVFPPEALGLNPNIVIATGVVGLLIVMRDPAPPISLADSEPQAFLDKARIHSARSLLAVLTFVLALFAGPDSIELVPLVAGLALALVSNEVERARRPTL